MNSNSRRFWVVVDVAFSTLVYFVTKYVAPEIGNDILWLIAAWQPVIVALIFGITSEKVAALNTALFYDASQQ